MTAGVWSQNFRGNTASDFILTTPDPPLVFFRLRTAGGFDFDNATKAIPPSGDLHADLRRSDRCCDRKDPHRLVIVRDAAVAVGYWNKVRAVPHLHLEILDALTGCQRRQIWLAGGRPIILQSVDADFVNRPAAVQINIQHVGPGVVRTIVPTPAVAPGLSCAVTVDRAAWSKIVIGVGG